MAAKTLTCLSCAQLNRVPEDKLTSHPKCGNCGGPEYAKAAGKLAGQARLVKLDTQRHQSTGGRYRIKGIPTLVGFAQGKEQKRQSGAMREGQITAWVKAL
mgnify:CR=1 FL=1